MRYDTNSKAEQDKKLFVGGLTPNTDERCLTEFYRQWGEIVDVVVMKDPRSQRSRCFGFVTYKEASSVDAAQTNRPHFLNGKKVDCKRAMPREEASPEVHATVKKIFVGGLKKETTNKDLHDYFSQFGNVIEASVILAKDTNTSRGFAFVTFDDTDSVDKVILSRPHKIMDALTDVHKAMSNEMDKSRSRPPPPRFGYGGVGGWNDPPHMSYYQGWDQGYGQPYPPQNCYPYNGSYGYGGYESNQSNGSWSMSDGFGSYQQHAYAGGPMRSISSHSRPGPYSNNGWHQR